LRPIETLASTLLTGLAPLGATRYTRGALKQRFFRDDQKEVAVWRSATVYAETEQFVFCDKMHLTREDETARRRGWRVAGSQIGLKAVGTRRFNVTAALSVRGFVAWDIAKVIEGRTADDEALNFVTVVTECLSLLLMPHPCPESVLVTDSASIQDVPGLEDYVVNTLKCVFLQTPPYRPCLSPLEEAFMEVKAYLRRHHVRARDDLVACIQDALCSITPQRARDLLAQAGYQ
jgi:hypothetical protein